MDKNNPESSADREHRPAALSEAKPHRSFSEKTMKDHDDLVRAAASHKAWLDLLERFSPKQRRDLAMLMAHNWTISAIEIQTSLNSSGKSDKRYDAETTVAQLFPNGSLKPRVSGADRERAITGEPVALTDERIDRLQEEYDCFGDCDAPRIHDFARAIEAECRAAPITGETSRDVAAESDKA